MHRDAVFNRTCNYFTLWELAGRSPKLTSALWERVSSLVDLTQPLPIDIGVRLSDPSLSPARVESLAAQVRHSVEAGLRSESDHILDKDDESYPRLLRSLEEAPQFLFARGNLSLLDQPALAVVGTRSASDEGVRRAYKIAYLLITNGIAVASGLAKGIDTSAHRGALSVGTETIAVIGTPLNTYYPPENEELQKLIERVGLVLTQFYPGAGVRRHYFPMRNAVMSGLCYGTIVIEASEHSGALIQARQCLKQGRKLFIPKSAVDDPRLTWPREYLRRGAHQFASIDDLVRVLRTEQLLPPGSEVTAARQTKIIEGVQSCLRK